MAMAIYVQKADGSRHYYTGRAGTEWLSPNIADAFYGYNLEGCKMRAGQLFRDWDFSKTGGRIGYSDKMEQSIILSANRMRRAGATFEHVERQRLCVVNLGTNSLDQEIKFVFQGDDYSNLHDGYLLFSLDDKNPYVSVEFEDYVLWQAMGW